MIDRSIIEGESFLLPALNGTFKPLPFLYSELLSTLTETSGDELAAWAMCSEPDNAFALVDNVWSLGNVYEEARQIEQTRGDSVQWGNCYLLLLPKSKNWMLVNYYRFNGFEISLHGTREFIDTVERQTHDSSCNRTSGVAA